MQKPAFTSVVRSNGPVGRQYYIMMEQIKERDIPALAMIFEIGEGVWNGMPAKGIKQRLLKVYRMATC